MAELALAKYAYCSVPMLQVGISNFFVNVFDPAVTVSHACSKSPFINCTLRWHIYILNIWFSILNYEAYDSMPNSFANPDTYN